MIRLPGMRAHDGATTFVVPNSGYIIKQDGDDDEAAAYLEEIEGVRYDCFRRGKSNASYKKNAWSVFIVRAVRNDNWGSSGKDFLYECQ